VVNCIAVVSCDLSGDTLNESWGDRQSGESECGDHCREKEIWKRMTRATQSQSVHLCVYTFASSMLQSGGNRSAFYSTHPTMDKNKATPYFRIRSLDNPNSPPLQSPSDKLTIDLRQGWAASDGSVHFREQIISAGL
jgi:hypothetical protein